jgi:flagellar protein FlaJ
MKDMFALKRQPVKAKNDKNKNPVKEDGIASVSTVQEKKISKTKQKDEPSEIYAKAYRLLSKRIKFLFPRFVMLESKLVKAAIPIPYEVYVCGMVLISTIASIALLAVGTIVAVLVNINPPEFRYFLPVVAGLMGWQGTFAIMYMKPTMALKGRGNKITAELPYFMGYMATLASSGVTLEGIFKAVAKEHSQEEIVKSSRIMVRNLDILGMDIINALQDLIKSSPSEPWSELLEGLISTVHSGGNLKEYFTALAKVQMEEKKMLIQRMTANLGIVAEMYTILLVVFPLMASIMLTIMAIMTGDLMGFDISTLMSLVTYLMVPMFGIMLLMMIDGMVPKR